MRTPCVSIASLAGLLLAASASCVAPQRETGHVAVRRPRPVEAPTPTKPLAFRGVQQVVVDTLSYYTAPDGFRPGERIPLYHVRCVSDRALDGTSSHAVCRQAEKLLATSKRGAAEPGPTKARGEAPLDLTRVRACTSAYDAPPPATLLRALEARVLHGVESPPPSGRFLLVESSLVHASVSVPVTRSVRSPDPPCPPEGSCLGFGGGREVVVGSRVERQEWLGGDKLAPSPAVIQGPSGTVPVATYCVVATPDRPFDAMTCPPRSVDTSEYAMHRALDTLHVESDDDAERFMVLANRFFLLAKKGDQAALGALLPELRALEKDLADRPADATTPSGLAQVRALITQGEKLTEGAISLRDPCASGASAGP